MPARGRAIGSADGEGGRIKLPCGNWILSPLSFTDSQRLTSTSVRKVSRWAPSMNLDPWFDLINERGDFQITDPAVVRAAFAKVKESVGSGELHLGHSMAIAHSIAELVLIERTKQLEPEMRMALNEGLNCLLRLDSRVTGGYFPIEDQLAK